MPKNDDEDHKDQSTKNPIKIDKEALDRIVDTVLGYNPKDKKDKPKRED